jgi:hypothetical protein
MVWQCALLARYQGERPHRNHNLRSICYSESTRRAAYAPEQKLSWESSMSLTALPEVFVQWQPGTPVASSPIACSAWDVHLSAREPPRGVVPVIR